MLLSRRGKRRLLVLALVAVAIGAGAAAFKAITRAQQARMAAQAREAGLAAYAAGDLAQAIAEFQYYFGQNKDDLEVNLTFAEAQSRQPVAGGRHLFDAVELYTTHGLDLIDRQAADGVGGGDDAQQRHAILMRLLEIYSQLGDRARVLKTAEALLATHPDMIDALAAKAEVLFLNRQFAETETVARRLIEIDPDSLTWRNMLLEVRSRQGDTNDMLVEQCRVWSEQYTADARFRLLTASVLVDAGRTEDARAELHAAGVLSANSRGVLEQLVSLLDALDLGSEANAAVASASTRFPQEWWPREVSVRRAWQNDEAERALQEVASARADLGEPPAGVRRLEVASLIALGRHADAVAALQPLLKISVAEKDLDVDRMWALAVSTVLTVDASDWRSVSDALEMAIATSPHDAVLQYLLGDASMRVGEQARAIAAYRRAYAAAPSWSAAGVAYGNALMVAGRLEEAHQIARLVVSRGGIERLQPFLLFASTHIALREAGMPAELIEGGDMLPEIVAALKQISQDLVDDPDVAALLVRAHLAAGDSAQAAAFMREAIADDGIGVETILALTDVARERLPELEEPMLVRARSIAGLTLPLAFAQADLFGRRGDLDGGLALINQAIAERPLTDTERETVGCARAAYLLRMNEPSALTTLNALVIEHADSPTVQRFALAQPQAWGDQRLIAQAMSNLNRLLGDESMQVRLAEANFLIQHHGREPVMLARAIVSINGMLEQDPDSLAALSLAAEALMLGEQPNPERAASHLEHAVRLYPAEPSLLTRLIATYQRQGRFDAARPHLQTLANLSQAHPDLAIDELRLLTAQGDFETALVRASAAVDETSPPSQQLLLAAIEERMGNVQRAEAVYERLLAGNPTDALVITQASEFFASTGRYARGLEMLQKALASGLVADLQQPAVSGDLIIGLFQQRHGRMQEAGDSLRAAVNKNPQSTESHNELARFLLAINEPAQAREQAMLGLRLDPNHVGLRSTLAIANLTLPGADRGEAIALLRKVGAENDALLAMLELMEQVAVKEGRSAPTRENLIAARRLTETHGLFLPAWQLAISLHLEAGETSDAISLARGAVGRLPGESLPAQWATQLLMQQSQWSEALAEAQEWRRRTLSDPLPAQAAAARILIALDRSPEAVQRLSPHRAQLSDERSQHPERVLTLVEALVRTGDVAGAESIIAPLLAEHVRWREAWMTAAGLMSASEAERILGGLDSGKAAPSERLTLATAWLALAQRTGSESSLMRAHALATTIEREPETAVGAAITLGAVAEMRGDLPAAERHYRAALAIAPENPVALNNLSFTLAQQGKAAEALPIIEKVLKVQPDQPDFLDTQATVFCGLSRFEEAEAALDRALVARPDDPALMLSLADVQLARHASDDAAITVSRVERRQATLDARQRQRLEDLRRRLAAAADAASADHSRATENSVDVQPTSKPTVP